MNDISENKNEFYASLEAILFAAGAPVTYDNLSRAMLIMPEELKIMISEAALLYKNRGIELILYEDSCQLCTKPIYSEPIKIALGLKKRTSLSKTSLETLALIAYKQPCTKVFIESVRGSDCTWAINVLLGYELIEQCGRLDIPGRPILYATTSNFLRCFGLSSLGDLPKSEDLPQQEFSDNGEINAQK